MATCRHENWLLKDLAMALKDKHTENKQIVVPMFQRGKRWKKDQEDTFIDSLIKGYPVGTMLFYRTVENNKEVYTLVDGLQRGNTIKKFMACPTKYLKMEDIPDNVIDDLYSILGLNGQEYVIKEGILKVIIDSIHNWTNYNGIQYYPIAKKIIENYPTTNQNAIDQAIKVLKPMLDKFKTNYEKIAGSTISVIIYTGPENTLTEIFKRINSKGTPLTTYEIYAASWPIKEKFKVDNDYIIERVLAKYDTLADDDFKVAGYNRDNIRKNKKLNAFEYLFGLSKFLNDKFDILRFKTDEESDVINPIAFELVNACLNDNKDGIKSLYMNILKVNVNQFEEQLIKCIKFVDQIIKPVIMFKGNNRKSNKILHSKYQILSMISTTFKEKYDLYNNFLVKETWKKNRNILKLNMIHHYVCDIIENEWNDGGTSKIHKAAKPNKYLSQISYIRWETVLDSYFEQSNSRQESKKVTGPSKEDIVFLNCIYLPLFSAKEQLSSKNFDIEHIATKKLMKDKIKTSRGLGLPISSISNLCYLPQNVNRSKNSKTFYQDSNYLKHINLSEVEEKYSFTQKEDLEWLDLNFNPGDYEVLKDYYFAFLKKRFKLQKKKFYESMNIEKVNNELVDEEIRNSNIKNSSEIFNYSDKRNSQIKKNTTPTYDLYADKISDSLNLNLKSIKRRLFVSDDNKVGVLISKSKKYNQGKRNKYWFSYHPYFRDDLDDYDKKFIAFVCGTDENIFLFPLSQIEKNKIKLNYTKDKEKIYWHIVFYKSKDNIWTWKLSKPEVVYVDISEKAI